VFATSIVNDHLPGRGDQPQDGGGAFLSGFFVNTRTWIKWLSLIFILPWAVPSIPTILSIRFMPDGGVW
jgi:hypothetical protein